MTGPDTTLYPFATRNEKEYFNIMDVYMDTTFNPELNEFSFMQEGWRHHLENENDPIEIKGVVYNEMKGAYSNPTSQAWYTLFEHLMPNSTYSHVSGGNPKNIPELTWDGLKSFHNKFYHPTNSIIFLYGDAPLEKELEFLHHNYLSKFEKQDSTESIEFGDKNNSFNKIESTYAINPEDSTNEKTFLVLGIPVSSAENEEEILALTILGEILFSSDASPLKLDFYKSKIGKDIEGGLLDQNHLAIMFIEVIGSEPEKLDSFLEFYKTSLNDILTKKIDKDLILSELNSYEFHNREQSCNSQRGLHYGMKLASSKKLNKNPFESLKFDKLFNSVRKKILKENYLEQLIEEKLLNFDNSVCVALKPEAGKNNRETEELKQNLADFKSSLSKEDVLALINKTQEFSKYQKQENSEDKLATLPVLLKQDIPKSLDLITPEIFTNNYSTTIINNIYAGGISYFNVGFDCSTIPQRLLPYLDIFGALITEIGTKNIDFIKFTTKKNIYTGGFSHQFSIYNQRHNRDSYKPILWFNIKILREYIAEGLSILEDVFLNFDFSNKERIKEILERNYAWIENHVQREGYHLSLSRAKATLLNSGLYSEIVSGSTAFLHIQNVIKNYDKMEPELISSINEIGRILINQNNSTISITAEEKDINTSKPILENIMSQLNNEKFPLQKIENNLGIGNDALITSAEIVYAVQAGDIFKSDVNYNGSFEVLKSYLGNEFLHEKVRAQGGAYGCFPILDSISGAFAFVSYRDPNVKSTFDAFNQVPEAIKNIHISERSLEQLIIRTYGNFDPLLSPYMKGVRARNRHLTGSSVDFLYNTLSEIKSTTIGGLKAHYESMHEFTQNSVRGIIGNKEKINNHKNLFDKLIQL